MADQMEVVLTSEATGQLWNSCVWDPRAGTTLMTYKGGSAAPHTLCLLGNDYVLSAEPGKPIIRSWALNKHEQSQLRMVCPGKVAAFTSTRDGEYCAAGIAEMVHVWQTGTGFLVATLKGHFQDVSCLAFSHDGAFLVSGGEDGQVLVWQTSKVIGNSNDKANCSPLIVFNHHTMTVRDICLGIGGLMASVSMDQTCKLYSLFSQTVILSCSLPIGLTSVALNTLATELYIGGMDGNIYSLILRDAPRTLDYHVALENTRVFTGHNGPVVCLSVSTDNTLLLSGALDHKAIIWDIPSSQILRVLPHKGPITNAFFTIASKNIFSEDLKATLHLRSLQRHAGSEEDHVVEVTCTERSWQSQVMKERAAALELQDNGDIPLLAKALASHGDEQEQQRLEKINEELYRFATEELLKPLERSAKTAKVTEKRHAEKEAQIPENNRPKKKKKKTGAI